MEFHLQYPVKTQRINPVVIGHELLDRDLN